jgi:hypothetical protein
LNRLKFYIWNVLIGFDEFANTILNGHPGETISARSGRAADQGKLWGKIMKAFLDWLQAGHVVGAELHDEQRAATVEYLEEKDLKK